ncbi:MAG: HEPN domain-containing protein [Chitinivibrionia bacterium]|nr:HEPN domain-containing protein [Chitinivibrionia bacterium]
MTKEDKIKYWIDLCYADLSVGETLVKNKHNLYAGFMCQQVVEKIIKGYFTKVKDNAPPHIHDLPKLAKLSGLYELLSEEQQEFIIEVNPFNIEARYPDYKNRIAQYLTDEITESVFKQTKEFFEWTKEKILS